MSRPVRAGIVGLLVVAGLAALNVLPRSFAGSIESVAEVTTVVPDPVAAAISPVVTDSTVVGLPVLEPAITFSCPTPGAGWIASAEPTEFRADEVGVNLWWLTRSGQWAYWGHFKNGVSSVNEVGPLDPGEEMTVGIGGGPGAAPDPTAKIVVSRVPTEVC